MLKLANNQSYRPNSADICRLVSVTNVSLNNQTAAISKNNLCDYVSSNWVRKPGLAVCKTFGKEMEEEEKVDMDDVEKDLK